MKYLEKFSFFKKQNPVKVKKTEIKKGDFVTLKDQDEWGYNYKNDPRYGKIYQVMFAYSKEYHAVRVKDIDSGEEITLHNKQIEIIDDNEFLQDIKKFNL